MNKFLRESKSLLGTLKVQKPLLAVLGNESCDLDSAVSAICLAFFMFKNQNSTVLSSIKLAKENVLPVLNIQRADLPLKTEVTYLFRKLQIDIDSLICKDEIDLKDKSFEGLILVDHHMSPYRNSVLAAVDHRPFDPNSNLPTTCQLQIKEVGSCATLVAEIISKDVNLLDSRDYLDPLKLLHSTIVLDTINFSKEADKARQLDHKMVEMIESVLKIDNVEDYRKNLFDELVKARADVSSLNSLQILSKDLKIISNSSNKIRIAFPGYPISVQEYIKLPDAEKNIQIFAAINEIDVVFLMGMKCIENSVRRDLGIINIKNLELFELVVRKLEQETPELNLQPHSNVNFLGGKFFEQLNIKLSRKQILPILKTVLDHC
jgi:exopolyphosphatase